MNNEMDKNVISVWGEISRRELFQRLAGIGLAFSLPRLAAASTSRSLGLSDEIGKPYHELDGQPFRDFTLPTGQAKDLFKGTEGKPGPIKQPVYRRRDAFWYSKPNSALGVNIFQYTQSPTHLSNSCAQAACATLLQKYGLVPAGLSGDAVTDRIYQTHPPDQTSGTTVPVLVSALNTYGLKSWSGYGADYGDDVMRRTLRNWVAAGYPCIVMLDMRAPCRITNGPFCGHYTVVFAYDDDETNGHVYLSNWNYNSWLNSWSVFKQAWSLPDYPARRYPLIIGWH
jgi:Peptidase_C39 like family